MKKHFIACSLLILIFLTSCWRDDVDQSDITSISSSSETTSHSEDTTTVITVTTTTVTVSVSSEETVSLELQEIRVVNQRLHDISESDEYRNMSQEERVNYFLDVLYDIAESGIDPFNYPLIEADSIVYFEEENEIRFNYINGTPAFIPIDDPAYGEDLQLD